MKAPPPLKLDVDHDPATCRECAAITRDGTRRRERADRTCQCCGTVVPAEHTMYIVGNLDRADRRDEWRMCGSCWRAGYQAGETIDSINQGRGAA